MHAAPASLRLGDRVAAVDDVRHRLAAPAEPGALSGVADLPPALGELVSNRVRALEVPRFARGFALFEQRLGLRVGTLLGLEQRLEPEQRQQLLECLARPAEGTAVPFRDEIEQGGCRARRVEV